MVVIVRMSPNCFFIEKGKDRYCISYDKCVASIEDGEYKEYSGEKFYSKTSVVHKGVFRRIYGGDIRRGF